MTILKTIPKIFFNPERGKSAFTQRRWILSLSKQLMGFHLTEQRKESISNEKWRDCGDYITLSFDKEFKIGKDHAWYDGPHYGYLLGFVRFWTSFNIFGEDDETFI